MYLETKTVIISVKARVKCLDKDGKRLGLELDGEIIRTGSEDYIYSLYENLDKEEYNELLHS